MSTRSARPPHLLHVFSTFVPAGPQVRTAQLFGALGDEFRHSVLAMDGDTSARELVRGRVDVRYLEAPPKAGSLVTAARMRTLVRRVSPDLVLTYNFGAIDTALAARSLRGVRLIHHEDGFRPDEAEGFKRRRIWLRRIALGSAVRVVVISRTLERIARELWKLPAERVAFIPNGIEVERYRAADGGAALRAALGISREALVVGAVGHLRPEKNLPRLLAVVERLGRRRDVHVLLLGEGPERAALEELAGRGSLGGRVHFVGYHPDPRSHYAAMDVFALTSDTEQMPMALLEAMASSLPALVTDVGDVREMLPETQADRVVPLGPDAVEQLAEALEGLARDPRLRKELGRANRARVERLYALPAMVEAYRAVYRAGLAGG